MIFALPAHTFALPGTRTAAQLYRDARELNAIYLRMYTAAPGPTEYVTQEPQGPQLTKDLVRGLARRKLRQAREQWFAERGERVDVFEERARWRQRSNASGTHTDPR